MRHAKDIFHCHIWISFLDSCLYSSVIPDWFPFNRLIALLFIVFFVSPRLFHFYVNHRYFYLENRFQSMRNWKVIVLTLHIIIMNEATSKRRTKKVIIISIKPLTKSKLIEEWKHNWRIANEWERETLRIKIKSISSVESFVSRCLFKLV